LKAPDKLAEFSVALAAGQVQFQTGDSLDYVAG
jgi:hypothetical protein